MIQTKNQLIRQNLNMSRFTSHRITADSRQSFNNMIEMLYTALDVNAIANAKELTLIIYVPENDEEIRTVIDSYVFNHCGLECTTTECVADPTANITAHEEEIAYLRERLDSKVKEHEEMKQTWLSCSKDHNRVKEQVEAIAVLINNIYPKH